MMSDFHPETWSPLWTVGTIVTGVQLSFMQEDTVTAGSVSTSAQTKQRPGRRRVAGL